MIKLTNMIDSKENFYFERMTFDYMKYIYFNFAIFK